MKKYSTIVLSLFVIPVLASALTVSSGTVCTMDAKLCSDGSYVSRSGPNCEFAACPSDLPGDTAPVVVEPCLNLKNDLYLASTDARTNSEVSALQNFLSPKYLNSDPTGYFGKLTLKAVQSFQSANGVRGTGYVGPVTRAKLKAITCEGKSTDGGTTTPSPVTLPPTWNVTISSVNPSSAQVGSTVTLSGTGLNTGRDYVLFSGYRIETIASKVANQVSFVVPSYLTNTINCIKAPCPLGLTKEVVPGTYTVQVVNDNGQSNEIKFVVTDGTVVVPPADTLSITNVSPVSGRIGDTIVISGYGFFSSETKLFFGGMSIPGTPVYNKNLGNFNSAFQFTVPKTISACSDSICRNSLSRDVVPGVYELAVENKLGRVAVKFEVLSDIVVGGTPTLSGMTPVSGPVKTVVTLVGQNLSTVRNILFAGYAIQTDGTKAANQVSFVVPEYLSACPSKAVACTAMVRLVTPGKYTVAVMTDTGTSNEVTFEVTDGTVVSQAPTIQSISPTSAKVGDRVQITGTNLNIGDDKVYFGGTLVGQGGSANAANSLSFIVPAYYQACPPGVDCKVMSQPVVPGTYQITVINKNGQSNSVSFSVVTTPTVQAPVIQNISPTSAKVGDIVRISGTNLNVGDDKVYFGGTLVSQTNSASIANSLAFAVPSYYQACPPGADCKSMTQPVVPGTYGITVINKFGQSNTVQLTVVAAPVSTTPGITVVSPNGGNVFTVGDIVPITWTSNGSTIGDKVTIALRYSHKDTTYASGISFEEYIMMDAPNTGTYSWKIPEYFSTGVQTNTFSIRVFSNTGFTDSSDNTFTINPAVTPVTDLMITSPSLTKSYMSSETVPVTWTPLSSEQYAVALLRTSDKNFLRFVFPSYNSQSNLSWSVPANIPAGSDYYLRVTQGNYRAKTGYSSTFSINMGTASALAITSMNVVTETLPNSTVLSRNLKWTTTGANSCTASGAWTGTQPTSGSYSIGFMLQSFTYTLTCSNGQGLSVTKSLTYPDSGVAVDTTKK